MVSEALESYENALDIVRCNTSREGQVIAPVVYKKKGILLLQKFKDSNDTADMANALSSLATGLELAEKQRKGKMRTDAQLTLLCADILEPVAELILTRPNEILPASLGQFGDGGREASPSGLLQRVLQLRMDASGRGGAVVSSEALLKHLADLAASNSATDEDMLLSCRVFDILAMSAIADQAQQGASSKDLCTAVCNVLHGIKSVASDDYTAASAHVHEWGARAIFSVLKHHGHSQEEATEKRILVEGAGEAVVNGYYKKTAMYNDSPTLSENEAQGPAPALRILPGVKSEVMLESMNSESEQSDAATAAQVVRVLTDPAKEHRRNAALSLAVCKALLLAMQALRGPAAGGGQVKLLNSGLYNAFASQV